tara:strand:+ start:823 stop:966 length:144 start_codon:yes stop_codon:yes gene_type:complete
MENKINIMEKFKIISQPHTVGFWRPIEVEMGFIEDDIKIELNQNKDD